MANQTYLSEQPLEHVDGSACPSDLSLLRVRANPERVIYCPRCGRWWLWDGDLNEWMAAKGEIHERYSDDDLEVRPLG
jgi:Zn-finger nucleic acid-binding protein